MKINKASKCKKKKKIISSLCTSAQRKVTGAKRQHDDIFLHAENERVKKSWYVPFQKTESLLNPHVVYGMYIIEKAY